LVAAAALAIVTQDQSVLRAAPRDSAQQQTVLSQGDTLEVRGETLDYLQVYDHRRERAGYVRASQVRRTSLTHAEAPELLAVARFVRDTPGSEATGIALIAAYIKAAPAQAIDAEPFDILGTLADRLARRASTASKVQEATVAAHIEVAKSYGVAFKDIERDGRIRVCYDGEAFRRVLAMSKDAQQLANAALAVTRSECIDPGMLPTARIAVDHWRAEVLDRVDATRLPEYIKNRVHARRAGAWASVAFHQARRGESVSAAATRALEELASVNKAELAEDDQHAYSEAAIRVGAVRWGASASAPVGAVTTGKVAVGTSAGDSGQTCVSLVEAKRSNAKPVIVRCTYGIVWTQSASVNAAGTVVTLAVQPLDAWRELWVFKLGADGWTLDVLPPASSSPDVGYVEFAGWVPGGTHFLAARETRVDGRPRKSFELIRIDTLSTEKKADEPSSLSTFYRWQDAAWKKQTVSLR
jgi:hypothetical protein